MEYAQLMGWNSVELSFEKTNEIEVDNFLNRFGSEMDTSPLVNVLEDMISRNICVAKVPLSTEAMDKVVEHINAGNLELAEAYEEEFRSDWKPNVEASLQIEKDCNQKRLNTKKAITDKACTLLKLNQNEVSKFDLLIDEIHNHQAYTSSELPVSVALRPCLSKNLDNTYDDISEDEKALLVALVLKITDKAITANAASDFIGYVTKHAISANDTTVICIVNHNNP